MDVSNSFLSLETNISKNIAFAKLVAPSVTCVIHTYFQWLVTSELELTVSSKPIEIT